MKRPPCPESRARLVDSLVDSHIHCSIVLATKNYGDTINRHPCLVFVSHLWSMGLNVLGYQSRPLQRYHPACCHKGPSRLSQVHALMIFYRGANSALLQLVNQWLNFTYSSRSHAFRYRRKKKNNGFHNNRTHNFRTTVVGVRRYVL